MMNLKSFIISAVSVLSGVAAEAQPSAITKLTIMTLSNEMALKYIGNGVFPHLAFVTKYKKRVPVIEEQNMVNLINFLNNEKQDLMKSQELLHSDQMRLIKELDYLIANEPNEPDYGSGRLNFVHSRDFDENKMNKEKVNREKRIIEQELAKVSWKLETIEQFLEYCPGGICGILVPRETQVSLNDDDLQIDPLLCVAQ
jgi:hypothetical protein